MEKLKAIFKKIVNKETILYIVFGVLTTLVNFVAFKLFTMVFDKLISSQLGVHISNVLAWIFAVAFAYVTNDYHIYRAGRIAGTDHACGVAATLPRSAYYDALQLNYYVREAFATGWLLLRGN